MSRSINPKTNGYSNKGRLALKDRKRVEGENRNNEWRFLTPKQQLAELDRRGVTATKQRRVLAQLIGGA